MPSGGLSLYKDFLYGCRFCPMCKPAGEVANLTLLESHTTRARAMLLWRIVNGSAQWGDREVELLYQSTLDSISQAFCINDYPVSEYVLAARADVYAAGLAPACVRQAAEQCIRRVEPVQADVLLLASETAEAGNEERLRPVLRLLGQLCGRARALVVPDGTLAYSLGAHALARTQAAHVAELIGRSSAALVVADGPRTLWALRQVYPALGVSLPDAVRVLSIGECLVDALKQGRFEPPRRQGRRLFYHDSRYASLLGDQMARAEAIQPGYSGAEETLGQGDVFDCPRALLDAMGMERLYSVWSRSLSKSCGADDGLWLTYADLAAGLARMRIEEMKLLGADLVVADSPLCALRLAEAADGKVEVRWLPELLTA